MILRGRQWDLAKQHRLSDSHSVLETVIICCMLAFITTHVTVPGKLIGCQYRLKWRCKEGKNVAFTDYFRVITNISFQFCNISTQAYTPPRAEED